jgi:hypothetical protein
VEGFKLISDFRVLIRFLAQDWFTEMVHIIGKAVLNPDISALEESLGLLGTTANRRSKAQTLSRFRRMVLHLKLGGDGASRSTGILDLATRITKGGIDLKRLCDYSVEWQQIPDGTELLSLKRCLTNFLSCLDIMLAPNKVGSPFRLVNQSG